MMDDFVRSIFGNSTDRILAIRCVIRIRRRLGWKVAQERSSCADESSCQIKGTLSVAEPRVVTWGPYSYPMYAGLGRHEAGYGARGSQEYRAILVLTASFPDQLKKPRPMAR